MKIDRSSQFAFFTRCLVGLLATGVLVTSACGCGAKSDNTSKGDQDLIGVDLGAPGHLLSDYESWSESVKFDWLQSQWWIRSTLTGLPTVP